MGPRTTVGIAIACSVSLVALGVQTAPAQMASPPRWGAELDLGTRSDIALIRRLGPHLAFLLGGNVRHETGSQVVVNGSPIPEQGPEVSSNSHALRGGVRYYFRSSEAMSVSLRPFLGVGATSQRTESSDGTTVRKESGGYLEGGIAHFFGSHLSLSATAEVESIKVKQDLTTLAFSQHWDGRRTAFTGVRLLGALWF
jgi:hypothetical protein